MPDERDILRQAAGKRAFPMPRLLPSNDVVIDYLALEYSFDQPSFEVAMRGGIDCFQKKDYSKCTEYLGVAYEISRRMSQPHFPMVQGVLFMRSVANSLMGKTVEALHDIEVSLQVLPHAAISLYWRGFLLLKTAENIEVAYRVLQQLVGANPEWRNFVELTIAFFLGFHGFQEKGILMCTRVMRRMEQEFGSLDEEFTRLEKLNEEKFKEGQKFKPQGGAPSDVPGSSTRTEKHVSLARDGNSSVKFRGDEGGIIAGSEQIGGSQSSSAAYRSYATPELERERNNVDLVRALAYFIRGESYKGHAHGAYFAQQAADDFSVVLEVASASLGKWLGKGISPDTFENILLDCKILEPHFPKANSQDYAFFNQQIGGKRPFSIFGRVALMAVKLKHALSPGKKMMQNQGRGGHATRTVEVTSPGGTKRTKPAPPPPPGGAGAAGKAGGAKSRLRQQADEQRALLAQRLGQVPDAAKPFEMWGPIDARSTHVTPYRRQWVQPTGVRPGIGSKRATASSADRGDATDATTAGPASKDTVYSRSQSPPQQGWYKKTDEGFVIPTPYELKFQSRSPSVATSPQKRRGRSRSATKGKAEESSPSRPRAKAPPETGKNPEIHIGNCEGKSGGSLGGGGGKKGLNYGGGGGSRAGWSQSLVSVAGNGVITLESDAVATSVIEILGLGLSGGAGATDDMAEDTRGKPPELEEATAIVEDGAGTVALQDVVGSDTLRAASEFAQMADAVSGTAAPAAGEEAPDGEAPAQSGKAADVTRGGEGSSSSASISKAATVPAAAAVPKVPAAAAPPKKERPTPTQCLYLTADPAVLETFGLRDLQGGEIDDVVKAHKRPFNKKPSEKAVQAALSRPSTDKPLPPRTVYDDWGAEALRRAEYYYRKELAELGEPSPTHMIGEEPKRTYERDDVCKHLRNIATWKKKDVIDAVYNGEFEDLATDYTALDDIEEVSDMATLDRKSYCRHFVAIS
ncbi:unnamed protein product [Amoebophrya sp. A120]|nr:unnamed protein product [Amoebophrya sp. A120]|eukprot:GSA120T00005204001.1